MNMDLVRLPGGVLAFDVWDEGELLGRLSQDVMPYDKSVAGEWYRFTPKKPGNELTFPMEMALVCVLRDIKESVKELR